MWRKDASDTVGDECVALGLSRSLATHAGEIKLERLVEDSAIPILLLDESIKWPGPNHPIWSVSSLTTVVGLRDGNSTNPAPGWNTQVHHVAHGPLGGVLKENYRVLVAWRGRHRDVYLPEPPYMPSQLVHRTDPTTRMRGSVPCRPPPEELEDCEFEARTLVAGSRVDTGTFKLPSVFTPTKWIRRRLSTTEKLACKDFPPELSKGAPESIKEEWLRQLGVPFKIRFHFLTGLDLALSSTVTRGEITNNDVKGTTNPPNSRVVPRGFDDFLDDILKHTKEELQRLAPEEDAGATDRKAKAAKNDDADVPIELWDERVAALVGMPPQSAVFKRACDTLRKLCLLPRWWRNVTRSYFNWRRSDPTRSQEPRNDEKARRAIRMATQSTWWDWPQGSGPFFWRWRPEFQQDLRDGLPPMFVGKPPSDKKPQRLNPDPVVNLRMKEKLAKMLQKRHLEQGVIITLMNFFAVPKATDIRMVFDGTRSGLNSVLHAPWFALPTVDSLLRTVDTGTWMGDDDYGEQFYNFWLHENLQPFTGIDLTRLIPELKEFLGKETVWARWCRPAMGLSPSPYQGVQSSTRAKREALGDPKDPKNVYAWDHVWENYPGSKDYDPSQPWISKRRKDGAIAVDSKQYVDDLRHSAPTKELEWQAGSKMSKTCAYLGLQIALRKRRTADQLPGAWQGAVVGSVPEPFKTIAPDRWEKNQKVVDTLLSTLNEAEELGLAPHEVPLKRRSLESDRSHLTYISRVYRPLVPYIKGLHNTIDGFRRDRDEGGWRIMNPADRQNLGLDDPDLEPEEIPEFVYAAPRLLGDLKVLKQLMSSESPPKVPVRPSRNAKVCFCFGDASGAGFGFSASITGLPELLEEFGMWKDSFGAGSSSNLREALNLLLRLRELVRTGVIPKGTQVFIFTDNAVTERAFWKGNCSSEQLFEVIKELRQLELEGHIFLEVIWVAGTRMIEQGTDGLSRGDFTTGVMLGRDMLEYVPLNKTAFERSSSLRSWIESWDPDGTLRTLNVAEWFHEAHFDGNWIWAPSPCVANVALEEMAEAKHARPGNTHVFVCPALMTMRWRKQLGKAADIVFSIPVGSCHWPSSMHEPLIVGVSFPLLSRPPWQLRRTKCMADAQATLSGLWSADCSREGDRLRELWVQARTVSDMPESVARQLLQTAPFEEDDEEPEDPNRFKLARTGDHLIVPFQCDVCHFVNIQHRAPRQDDVQDEELLLSIRRANLDAFWARETATVKANLTTGLKMASLLAEVGISDPFGSLQRGPFPVEDTFGMSVAVAFLRYSLAPGINAATIQYHTARKIRSFFSNFQHTTPGGTGASTTGAGVGKMQFTFSVTSCLWFCRFMEGAHRRMGDVWCPDRALAIAELTSCLDLLENDWTEYSEVADEGKLFETAIMGAALCAGFSAALRGEEIPKLDLGGIREHLEEGLVLPAHRHVMLCLTGRFKGETGERAHYMPVEPTTASGVANERWIVRLVNMYATRGVSKGPLFRKKSKGKPMRAKVADLDPLFHDVLRRVQKQRPNLIPPDLDVAVEYSLRRSVRRGSNTQARNQRVPEAVINHNNRWRAYERARGRAPGGTMLETYSEARAALPLKLQYSAAL